MKTKLYLFLLTGGIAIAGCGDDDKKPVVITRPNGPVIQSPFRYQKHLEVAPGNDFDVLSWGRGATDAGSLLILHSDSLSMQFTTTTGDLEGSIVDVYNADMDVDGNPELLIQASSKDTTKYTNIYTFEFNGDDARKLKFPNLTNKQSKGYRGKDNFYIKEGKFIREFPIYDGEDKEAKPTGAKRVLEYGLRNNNFTVDQLSKDSVDKSEPVVAQPKKQEEKKRTVSKKSFKKKKSSSRSKRRRRRN